MSFRSDGSVFHAILKHAETQMRDEHCLFSLALRWKEAAHKGMRPDVPEPEPNALAYAHRLRKNHRKVQLMNLWKRNESHKTYGWFLNYAIKALEEYEKIRAWGPCTEDVQDPT